MVVYPHATSPTTRVAVPAKRAEYARLARASAPALGIYVASRVVVLMTLGVVAKLRHHALGHYLTRWDSHWYIQIARSGYASAIPRGHGNAAQVNLGFFPLLPLLIRFTHWVTSLSFAAAGETLTWCVGAAAAVAVWWLVRDRAPPLGDSRPRRRIGDGLRSGGERGGHRVRGGGVQRVAQ